MREEIREEKNFLQIFFARAWSRIKSVNSTAKPKKKKAYAKTQMGRPEFKKYAKF